MKLTGAALACVLLPLGSCATGRWFAPRVQVAGWSVSGAPMAVYGLGERGALGELRIWSDGAELLHDAEGDHAFLHVGFEVVNLGEGTLTLEPGDVHLQDLQGEGGAAPVADLPPSRSEERRVGKE